MPVKKRPDKARPHPVTREAVAAYRAGDETKLRQLLRLKPWQLSPLGLPETCPYPDKSAAGASYHLARDLRDELEASDAG